MLRTALLLALLASPARPEAPLLLLGAPNRVLTDQGRSLDPRGTLMLSPGARTVVLRGPGGVQVWSGETGALLASTFPPSGSPQEIVYSGRCGNASGIAGVELQSLPRPCGWASDRFEVREGERLLAVDPWSGAARELPAPPAPGRETRRDAVLVTDPEGRSWVARDEAQSTLPEGFFRRPWLTSSWASEDASVLAAVRHTVVPLSPAARNAFVPGPETLLVWRRDSPRPLRALPLPRRGTGSLALSPSGRWLLCTFGAGEVRAMDLQGTGDQVVPGILAAWWPEREKFLVQDLSTLTYEVWALGAEQPRLRFRFPRAPEGERYSLEAVSPEARWVATLKPTEDGTLAFELWDLENPQ